MTRPVLPVVIRAKHHCPAGSVSFRRGRPLLVVRAYGSDAAAPVIVEELTAVGFALPGQLGLWPASEIGDGYRSICQRGVRRYGR